LSSLTFLSTPDIDASLSLFFIASNGNSGIVRSIITGISDDEDEDDDDD